MFLFVFNDFMKNLTIKTTIYRYMIKQKLKYLKNIYLVKTTQILCLNTLLKKGSSYLFNMENSCYPEISGY